MIKFGTDGWRAVIGDDWTFENIRIVAQAIADYMHQAVSRKKTGSIRMAVGYDTRFLSDSSAQVISEVLAGSGIKVFLSDGATTTPAVSLTIKRKKLNGGIIITASHNPPKFNGLKFKADFAGSADPEITQQIEKNLYCRKVRTIDFEKAVARGLIKKEDFTGPHIKFLTSYVDFDLIANSRFKILVDPMYGGSDSIIEKIFKGTSCRVTTIHHEPNPIFGGVNPEPLAHNLTEMAGLIRQGKYHLGIANDGDGDRIGALGPDGIFINPHQIFCLLLLHLVEDRKWSGAVATTISASVLIERMTKAFGLKLYETPVGFKHICKLMRQEDILIGGEESGGIGFKNYIPERDGVLSGLLLLEIMAYRRKGIIQIMEEMYKRFGRFWYERLDIEYPDDKKKRMVPSLKKKLRGHLLDKKITEVKDYDGLKVIAEDSSWLLFRLSGTEPILRIYAEAPTKRRVKRLIELGLTEARKV